MKDVCLATYDLFPNKVNVHLNIFSTNIITVHQSSLGKWAVNLKEKIAKPTQFRNHISNTHELSFCTGARKRGLLFGRPGNEVVTKKQTIARGRMTSVRTIITHTHSLSFSSYTNGEPY